MINIVADLHVHTLASGHAYSTIDDIASSASKKGLKIVAITDHGPAMPGGPHRYYFGNMAVLPEKIHGVRIISGVEANIIDGGQLDLPEKRIKKLDFIAAGLHHDTGYTGETVKENTETIIKAIENPYTMMITHPANLGYPLELRPVVEAAVEYGVILEVNASSFDDQRVGKRGGHEVTLELCRLAREYGAYLCINSDAHYAGDVGKIDHLADILKNAGLKEKDILNSSLERLEAVLELNLS